MAPAEREPAGWVWPAVIAAGVALAFFFFSDPFLAPPDCAFYWAWAESLLRGGSFAFGEALERLQMPARYCYVTRTGRLANDWPMGTGLMLLPVAWAGVTAAHGWVVLLAVATLTAWWRRVEGPRWMKATALAGLVAGTPLLFYVLFGPFFSHVVSFVVVSGFLLLWAGARGDIAWGRWLAMGLLLGLACLIRPQSCLLAGVFLLDLRWMAEAWRSGRALQVMRGILLPLAGGLLLGLAPRFPAYGVIYGNPLYLPKLDEMQWLRPHLWLTVFSDYHGVLPWTPVYALGIVGLFAGLGVAGERRMAGGMLLALGVQLYVNAANEVWWSGGSFGNRRLVDFSLPVAFGLMFLMRGRGVAMRALVVAAVAACCAWSLTLLLAERRLIVPLDRYVPFGRPGFTRGLERVFAEPAETWRALTRGLAAPGMIGPRAVTAVVLGGAVWGVIWWGRWRGELRGRRCAVALAGAMAGLSLICLVAAMRTPRLGAAEVGSGVASSSTILWDNYMELANYYLVKGEPEEAKGTALKAIGVLPEGATGYWYLGVAELQMGDGAGAAAAFRRVLELEPGHGNAAELLAEAEAMAARGARLRYD